MIRNRVVLLLEIFLVIGCGQNNKEHALEVTYIANEGFMIAMGSTNVLIDALPASKYYVNPSDTLAARMMNGIPPFDKVDYFLVTHDHADHFNAEMMCRFLLNHPAVQLIAGSETCSKLTGDSIADRRRSAVELQMGQHVTIRGEKAEIMAVRLGHGGGPNINNLAYFVRSNGYSILHVGDAKLSDNEEYLRTIDWSSYTVDLLFVEYFDQSSQSREIIENMIKPKHVILMHIPAGEETSVAKLHPRTVVFGKENETRRFDNLVEDGLSH
jgi:L-ascorbate metabolism protein UlaG (beta-lactamase superfamily)